MVKNAKIIKGCPNCGGSTLLTGVDHGVTQRTCRKCGSLIEHIAPKPEPGNYGYQTWGPQEELSNEFQGEK